MPFSACFLARGPTGSATLSPGLPHSGYPGFAGSHRAQPRRGCADDCETKPRWGFGNSRRPKPGVADARQPAGCVMKAPVGAKKRRSVVPCVKMGQCQGTMGRSGAVGRQGPWRHGQSPWHTAARAHGKHGQSPWHTASTGTRQARAKPVAHGDSLPTGHNPSCGCPVGLGRRIPPSPFPLPPSALPPYSCRVVFALTAM